MTTRDRLPCLLAACTLALVSLATGTASADAFRYTDRTGQIHLIPTSASLPSQPADPPPASPSAALAPAALSGTSGQTADLPATDLPPGLSAGLPPGLSAGLPPGLPPPGLPPASTSPPGASLAPAAPPLPAAASRPLAVTPAAAARPPLPLFARLDQAGDTLPPVPLAPSPWPPAPLAALDPARVPHAALIHEAAAYYSLPPALLLALIQVESRFNPRAVSRKGALGLTQLMPATAQDLGVTDPFDPRQNVFGGARFLRSLLNEFEGRVTLAVAAYNAGPGAVRRHRGVPPLAETQNYVPAVLALYHAYQARLSPPVETRAW